MPVVFCEALSGINDGLRVFRRHGDAVRESASTDSRRAFCSAPPKLPEEDYNFKPSETVRSYGQIIGHLADAQYLFCLKVLDGKNPEPKIEQTKTSKPDLIVLRPPSPTATRRTMA